ncbi:unnamed protein product [Chondrus crispus]|uniref:Uncharacterized protein n=1 Tax=Chondrus crispus TaxID=2769 RepID=R7QUB6_CHOCR|nr:unnamed protein product [Chondrus crispus]CDF41283.1 unnamed protein product [Chondrus crispus]|eukprot:XP_005711577.1 unnamed protein product [Chondrus crispus]
MGNDDEKLIDNVATIRKQNDASLAAFRSQCDANIVWLKETAASLFDFLPPSSGPSTPPSPRPPTRVQLKQLGPLPTIAKERGIVRRQQTDLIRLQDKENVENGAELQEEGRRPRVKIPRTRKRAPLATVVDIPLQRKALSREKASGMVDSAVLDSCAKGRKENSVKRNSRAPNDATPSSKNTSPASFNSALSHDSIADKKRVSEYFPPPNFDSNGEEEKEREENEPERNHSSTPLNQEGTEEVKQSREATKLSHSTRRSSISDAEFEDARQNSEGADEGPDRMDTSDSEGVPSPEQHPPSPCKEDDVESGTVSKSTPQKRAQQQKAVRPKKIARTDIPPPEPALDLVHAREESASFESEEEEDADSDTPKDVVSLRKSTEMVSIRGGVAKTQHTDSLRNTRRTAAESHPTKSSKKNPASARAGSGDRNSPGGDGADAKESPVIRRRRRPRKELVRSTAARSPQSDISSASEKSVERGRRISTPAESNQRIQGASSPSSSLNGDNHDSHSMESGRVSQEERASSIAETQRNEDSGTHVQANSERSRALPRSDTGSTCKGTGHEATNPSRQDLPLIEATKTVASLDTCKSPIVNYKMPKPRQRPVLTSSKMQYQNAGTADSIHSAVKHIPQTPQGSVRSSTIHDRFADSSSGRFPVDENGKLEQGGIGALSKIVSTPSTSANTSAGQGSIRANRLFTQTNNIYSAMKPRMSVQRSRSTNPKMPILHTPGARTPGKHAIVSSGVLVDSNINTHVSKPTTPESPLQNTTGILSKRNVDLSDAKGMHKKMGLPRELSFQTPAMAPSVETVSKSRRFEKHLTFSTANPTVGQGDGKTNFAAAPEPKTAPAQRAPLSRIEGKQGKSALRCKIESLYASKSSFTPQIPRNVDVLQAGVDEVFSDPQDGVGKCNSGTVLETRAISRDIPIKSTEESWNETMRATESSSVEDETTPSEKRIHHQQTNRSKYSEPMDDSLPEQTDHGILQKSLHVHIPGAHEHENLRMSLGNTSPDSGRVDVDRMASHSPSDRESDDKGSCTGRDENVIVASPLTNLVSSVSSFLPTPNEFSKEHKPEEKRASFEARQALKRHQQDMERREAEILARREAQRTAKQKEIDDKQRKAEKRRRLLAEAEKDRTEELRRKEQMRARKRREEEERQRIKKGEEDKRKEERRRRVLDQKKQIDKAAQRKEADAKRYGKLSKLPRPKLGQHGTTGNQFKQKQQQRPGHLHSRLPPTGSSRVPKMVSADSVPPPRTPQVEKRNREAEEPQWVMTAERHADGFETSVEERKRRRNKTVPSWAGKQALLHTLQAEKSDPDTLFARGAPSCNLETVFDVDEEKKRKYRSRDESGDWTRDRLTAQEEMHYKRQAGFFENA